MIPLCSTFDDIGLEGTLYLIWPGVTRKENNDYILMTEVQQKYVAS